MKTLVVLALCCVAANAFAQVDFETGYWIDNQNIRTEGLIKNADWFNNPTRIKVKRSEDGDVQSVDVATVKELVVGKSKFVRVAVDIDTSVQQLGKLGFSKEPSWKHADLFLKVLVEGKATLYYFKKRDNEKFFFSVDGGEVRQLVYRQYMATPTEVGRNSTYVSQLLSNVFCASFEVDAVKDVKYQRQALVKYFEEYNACYGAVSVSHQEAYKSLFHLKIAPGADFSKLKQTDTEEKVFPNQTSFRLGAELEFVMPFNRNKWALLLEPTYQSYVLDDVVDYKSLEIPFGVRHYFYLGHDAALFLNGGVVFDIPFVYEVNDWQKMTFTMFKVGASVGGGVQFKRFSLEARYYSAREAQNDLGRYYVRTSYSKFSVIAGFRIF